VKTIVVIQARMGAKRFPGKVLAPLSGRPVIDHVIARAREAAVGRVVVAMPNTDENGPLASWLADGIPWYAGSESDVLARYSEAVERLMPEAEVVVRITADCPLVDPLTIANMVDRFHAMGALYLGRTNAPDGNDVEVFMAALLYAAQRNAGPDEREHVTTWMRKQTDAVELTGTEDLSDVKYSVDTVEDLAVCERLIAECGNAGWRDHVAALRRWRTA
jgi:spore coat polysaccharide biosynthesis protein SpsF (cytidylyltransferase family)